MFEVEKPRRFHYQPRFYDPEKERWEALKKKYAMQQEAEAARQKASTEGEEEMDLEYFEQRVRTLDRRDREAAGRLTWRDLFRKRQMPIFRYQPRFSGEGVKESRQDEGETGEAIVEKYRPSRNAIKIRRRFDISDPDYMKPVSGGKIILYCFIVFLLVTVIIAL